MEIVNRGNSLKQQLSGVFAFTEVPLPEKKREFISRHDSGKILSPPEPPLLGYSFGTIPSRPRSKPLSNPKRRVNKEWVPSKPLLNPKRRVDKELIQPVTPSKNESQVASSESQVPETDSVQREPKRKKYKPKVVDDGAGGKKLTKSDPVNFTSKLNPGNSTFPITPDLKHTNANNPRTPDPKSQDQRAPIAPALESTNHEAHISCDSKPTIPDAPVTPGPIAQQKRVQITPDPKCKNPEALIMPNLTCTDSELAVTPDPKPKSIRFSDAADSKPEKLEVLTPDLEPDLKASNLPGSIQFLVTKKRGLRINNDKSTTVTELSLEKSSTEMQLNNNSVVKLVKSAKRRLDFGHEDHTELVGCEETTTRIDPNLDKSIIAINLNCDDAIELIQPAREGLDYDPEAENEPVMDEENIAGTSGSPEKCTGIITSLNCSNVVKPVQLKLVEDGLNFDLGGKTEAVMHGEVVAGMDSSLHQGETENVKHLTEDIYREGLKDYLVHLARQNLRSVKRERAPKSEYDKMLNEITLKMKHIKLYENAIFPYQEKKERYRGIVALDEDSLIEWNLLMGEDVGGFNSAPGANPEREEKWRKERDTFRNLAESFITKMKLIQGDRRFSEWKGSVVDSVVGAFLTQNVSDQLSSSAFISLCARYPRQQDENVAWPENKFSDFEWKNPRLADKPTFAVAIVNPHIQSRPEKVPKVNTLQEFTTEQSGSHKAKKDNGKKGYKTGMEHIEWDTLRKEASGHRYTREGRSVKREDAADWDAVRQADTSEVAKAIHGRGQDNVLAERIRNFLNRVAKDHGSVDLEWLRETPGDQAKEYLLSVYGLGLKSVECVRLLALHQVAFPVDTNVGRICVRLGWVPLQPLPESVQLHLLEMYPVMDSIQKYLWPRLCKLDQETLYELHYHMITFGKVFCTKSKPNCNACPLRSECKHFASAFASARLLLPGLQEHQQNKVVHWNGAPTAFQNVSKSFSNPTDVPTSNSEPIIEEPMTPEEEPVVQLPDIEDLCFDDPDEIPTIKLNMESLVRNIEELVRKNDSELQIEDISKALVLLPPIATSIPPPQLKHSRHLRTVHDAYELPDWHPILHWLEFEARDPADPSPYLLILYSPDREIADVKPCLCTSCNEAKSCEFLSKEEEDEYVKCSIMIPCRTAMRGSFPLNGTYFQVNEVLADHGTTRNPVMVHRDEIWMLRRRPVYCGSTVSAILKGLRTDEVQYCFWRGFVCMREFDRATRYPKPLSPWLHVLPTMRKKAQQTK